MHGHAACTSLTGQARAMQNYYLRAMRGQLHSSNVLCTRLSSALQQPWTPTWSTEAWWACRACCPMSTAAALMLSCSMLASTSIKQQPNQLHCHISVGVRSPGACEVLVCWTCHCHCHSRHFEQLTQQSAQSQAPCNGKEIWPNKHSTHSRQRRGRCGRGASSSTSIKHCLAVDLIRLRHHGCLHLPSLPVPLPALLAGSEFKPAATCHMLCTSCAIAQPLLYSHSCTLPRPPLPLTNRSTPNPLPPNHSNATHPLTLCPISIASTLHAHLHPPPAARPLHQLPYMV